MPGWARRPSNIVWENEKLNLSRGSRNMTAKEVAAVKSANRVSGISATTRGVAKGGAIAAVIEAPVAGVENFLHWKRGRKSRGRQAQTPAKSTVGAAVVGAGVYCGGIDRDFTDSRASRSSTSRSRGGPYGWYYCPSPVQGESKDLLLMNTTCTSARFRLQNPFRRGRNPWRCCKRTESVRLDTRFGSGRFGRFRDNGRNMAYLTPPWNQSRKDLPPTSRG